VVGVGGAFFAFFFLHKAEYRCFALLTFVVVFALRTSNAMRADER
jgi:hypothetical protein